MPLESYSTSEMSLLTACDVDNPVTGESFDEFGFELVVGVAVTQAAVASLAPGVQFPRPGDGG